MSEVWVVTSGGEPVAAFRREAEALSFSRAVNRRWPDEGADEWRERADACAHRVLALSAASGWSFL